MIKYSQHAREQMVERGISVNEVETALTCGSKELQYPDKILFHFRYFTVVAKIINNEYFIITVKPKW